MNQQTGIRFASEMIVKVYNVLIFCGNKQFRIMSNYYQFMINLLASIVKYRRSYKFIKSQIRWTFITIQNQRKHSYTTSYFHNFILTLIPLNSIQQHSTLKLNIYPSQLKNIHHGFLQFQLQISQSQTTILQKLILLTISLYHIPLQQQQQQQQQYIHMQKTVSILKRDYLTNPQTPQIDDEVCLICNDLVIQPVLCQGPCKKKYCRRCASIWKNQQDVCPIKCNNSPWKIQLVAPLQLELRCPFDQNCKILFVENLKDHIENCEFQPPHQLQQNLHKKFYRCKIGHPLQFYIGSYNNMLESVCAGCDQKDLSRSHCPKCDQFYCVRCRKPQSSKECCPVGHKYSKLEKIQCQNYLCDICGLKGSHVNVKVYDDNKCNFGICELCFETLPDKLPKPAIDTQKNCDQSHALTQLPKAQLRECSSCQKQRKCLKRCEECKTSYCLKCKPILVNQNHCQFQHTFKQLSLQENQTNCQYCSSAIVAEQLIYRDEDCGVQLCRKCFTQHQQKQIDKLRFKFFNVCSQQHSLKVYSGNTKLIKSCSECKQMVNLQYFCSTCKPVKFYCYKCKPFSVKDGCLLKHALIPYPGESVEEQTECMFCHEKTKELVYCKFCRFIVCQNCLQKQ